MTERKRLIVALACGMLAALCLGIFLWNQARAAARTREEVFAQFEGGATKILVARKRIEPGALLSANLYEEESWPALLLPEGALLADKAANLEGRRARALILPGEPLTDARVFEQRRSLDHLTAGMTAVTLSTDAVHALGGELLRGMRVTLMGALVDGRVAPLATDIEVLSANTAAVSPETDDVDKSENEGSTGRSGLLGGSAAAPESGEDIHWVTLAVPGEQVSQVLAAANANTVYLVLPKAEAGVEGEL